MKISGTSLLKGMAGMDKGRMGEGLPGYFIQGPGIPSLRCLQLLWKSPGILLILLEYLIVS